MKKSRIMFLAIAILSLLLGAMALSSAAAGSNTITIVSKNISYDNDLKFVVAVPKSQVTDTLSFTVTADGKSYTVTKTVAQLESDSVSDPTIGGTPCYAIISDLGVALKDMDKSYTLTVQSGNKTSAPIDYSMSEYLYERLFKNRVVFAEDGTPDADRRLLYLTTLSLGADAQRVLCNLNADPSDDVTTFADGYFYSNVSGEGEIYKPGDKMVVTDFVSVYSYSKTGDVWSRTESILTPGEITVDAHIVLSDKSLDVNFEDGQTLGGYLTEQDTTYTTHEVVSGEDAPALSDGKVLKVTQNVLNKTQAVSLSLAPMYSEDGGNIYVFDFDAYFTTPNVLNSTRYFFAIYFGGATIHFNGYGSANYRIRVGGFSDAHASGYTLNEWGSYRIVFEVIEDGKANAHVYSKASSGVAFERVCTLELINSGIKADGVDGVGIVAFNYGEQATAPYTYYLDNLFFGRIDENLD